MPPNGLYFCKRIETRRVRSNRRELWRQYLECLSLPVDVRGHCEVDVRWIWKRWGRGERRRRSGGGGAVAEVTEVGENVGLELEWSMEARLRV